MPHRVMSILKNTKMPVKKVYTTRNGKTVEGYRWGDSGKIYTGPGAQAKATRQGQAAYAAGYRSKTTRRGTR